MIDAAKGDIVFEPLEMLLVQVVRAIGKASFGNPPSGPAEQWGWPEWLWVAIFIALVGFLVSYLMGRRRRAGR